MSSGFIKYALNVTLYTLSATVALTLVGIYNLQELSAEALPSAKWGVLILVSGLLLFLPAYLKQPGRTK